MSSAGSSEGYPAQAAALGRDLLQADGRGLHEKLANVIGEAIVSGRYPPGAALPPEIDLCGRMSVSRSALREAFKLLASKRLIRSRQKVGTQVRPTEEWNMLDGDVLGWHIGVGRPSPEFVADLFELRCMIEPPAASMAAARRPEAEMRAMARAHADMRRFALDRTRLLEADQRFHAAVLQATGNPFLASFASVIDGLLAANFKIAWNNPASPPMAETVEDHGQLAALIAAGACDAAQAKMADLLRTAQANLVAVLHERAGAR